jgi:hypothetical protein
MNQTDTHSGSTGTTGTTDFGWDALDARLAASAPSATFPSYRRIWFSSLIRQGREADAQGRAALAAHCRTRLEQEFLAFGISLTSPAPQELEATAVAVATPSSPSPLKALAARRDLASRARLRELLDRHATRLSPDEVTAYRQALEGATEAGTATISELRRRLVDRLMRAARYRRHAARLAAWRPAPAEGVSGPYNDYRALEDIMHRIATANPHAAEWAAEFFDIYADMRHVRIAYGTVLPGK